MRGVAVMAEVPSSSPVPDAEDGEEGERWSVTAGLAKRKRRSGPSLSLTAQEALALQLDVLQKDADRGILLLYDFALFNPWERASYFGRKLDLGQFERFRNVIHTKPYRVLLRNRNWAILSITRGERERVFRIRVEGFRPGEEAQYTVVMKQLVGGLRDGCWMTSKVISEVSGHSSPPFVVPTRRLTKNV